MDRGEAVSREALTFFIVLFVGLVMTLSIELSVSRERVEQLNERLAGQAIRVVACEERVSDCMDRVVGKCDSAVMRAREILEVCK